MRCFQCNAELPEDSQFCSFCGAQQPAAQAAPEETPLPTQTETTPEDAAVYTPEPYAEAGQPPLDAPQPADAGVDAEAPVLTDDFPQKKSKKGLIVGLVAGFAVLVIGAVIAALLLGGDPLARAFVGTQNALQQMTERSSNLNTMGENLSNLIESEKFTYVFSMDMQQASYGDGDMDLHYELQINGDEAAEPQDGSMTLALDYQGIRADGTLRFSLDGEKLLLLSMDGIDGVYGIAMDDLLELMGYDVAYDASDSAYTLDLKPLDELTAADLKNGPMQEVFETVESSREGKTRIETDGGEKICDHYVLRWDANAVDRCIDRLEHRIENNPTALFDNGEITTEALVSLMLVAMMEDMEPSIDVYICQDRIVGLDLRGSGDSDTTFVRLMGKDNVWEHVRISTEGGSGSFDFYWDRDGSLSLCLTENGREQEFFRYDDGTGRFSLNTEMLSDSAAFDGKLSGENGGAEFSIHIADGSAYGFDLSATISLLPLQQQPKMLSDSYTDLTKLSDAEGQALVMDVMRQLGLSTLLGGDPLYGGDDDSYDSYGPMPPELPDTETETTPVEIDPDLSEESLYGTYTLKYARYDDYTIDYEDLVMGDYMSVTLSSGGAATFASEGVNEEVNWSFDGATVSLTVENIVLLEFRYEDGNLIHSEAGMELVFVR